MFFDFEMNMRKLLITYAKGVREGKAGKGKASTAARRQIAARVSSQSERDAAGF